MRHLMLIVMLAVGMVSVAQGAGDLQERVVTGLLKFGQKKLEKTLEEREAAAEAKAQEEAAAQAQEGAGAEAAKKRTWRDRGGDMLGAFVGTALERAGDGGNVNDVVAFSLKESMDVLINEYKEQYKQEGREYAQELGDRMVERVKADPKISGTLTAIEVLCWVIVGYLSFVTLFVFFALFAVLRGQKKLRRGYDALAKKFDELRAAVSIKTK